MLKDKVKKSIGGPCQAALVPESDTTRFDTVVTAERRLLVSTN